MRINVPIEPSELSARSTHKIDRNGIDRIGIRIGFGLGDTHITFWGNPLTLRLLGHMITTAADNYHPPTGA